MKFLDLLNKPVRLPRHFRRPSTPDTAADQLTTSPAAAAVTASLATTAALDAVPDEIITASRSHPCPSSLVADKGAKAVAQLARQLDEAALLFATEQAEAAIQVVLAALALPLPPATETEQRAWWILLELHAVLNQQAAFDRAALAYAQRFEASPPQWRPRSVGSTMPTRETAAIRAPTLHLRGSLDDDVDAMLLLWQQQHAMAIEKAIDITVDLGAVTAVALPGCHSLLAMLANCQQRGLRVQLRSADTMLTLLRALIQSGRRDEDDAGWRLLIELLRLAGDVERYEDACLAYSLTYEVSPPIAPQLPAAVTQARQACSMAFALPETITLPIDGLLVALRAHMRHMDADASILALDAHRLQQIDFHAAAALQASLVELAAGKPVEWQGVSFLVSTLLQLSCGNTMPRIINRKP